MRNRLFLAYIFVFSLSCNEVTEKAVSQIENNKIENEYFVIEPIFRDKLTMDFTLKSKEVKKLSRNLALYTELKNGQKDIHLGQWDVKNNIYKNSYNIPDSLLRNIKTLSFCLFYFDSKVMKTEITTCKTINIDFSKVDSLWNESAHGQSH